MAFSDRPTHSKLEELDRFTLPVGIHFTFSVLPFFRIGFLLPQVEHGLLDLVDVPDSSPLLGSVESSKRTLFFFLTFDSVMGSVNEASEEVLWRIRVSSREPSHIYTAITTATPGIIIDKAYSDSASLHLSICSTQTMVFIILVGDFALGGGSDFGIFRAR